MKLANYKDLTLQPGDVFSSVGPAEYRQLAAELFGHEQLHFKLLGLVINSMLTHRQPYVLVSKRILSQAVADDPNMPEPLRSKAPSVDMFAGRVYKQFSRVMEDGPAVRLVCSTQGSSRAGDPAALYEIVEPKLLTWLNLSETEKQDFSRLSRRTIAAYLDLAPERIYNPNGIDLNRFGTEPGHVMSKRIVDRGMLS